MAALNGGETIWLVYLNSADKKWTIVYDLNSAHENWTRYFKTSIDFDGRTIWNQIDPQLDLKQQK